MSNIFPTIINTTSFLHDDYRQSHLNLACTHGDKMMWLQEQAVSLTQLSLEWIAKSIQNISGLECSKVQLGMTGAVVSALVGYKMSVISSLGNFLKNHKIMSIMAAVVSYFATSSIGLANDAYSTYCVPNKPVLDDVNMTNFHRELINNFQLLQKYVGIYQNQPVAVEQLFIAVQYLIDNPYTPASAFKNAEKYEYAIKLVPLVKSFKNMPHSVVTFALINAFILEPFAESGNNEIRNKVKLCHLAFEQLAKLN